MNPIVGYVLIAMAVLNLAGLLLLFRRLGTSTAVVPSVPAPVAPPEAERDPLDEPAIAVSPDALANMLRRLEHRLGDIEDQVRRGPTVTVASEPSANSDRSLALAQRLARQGASASDIAETCGISLTEAELLQRLHAPR